MRACMLKASWVLPSCEVQIQTEPNFSELAPASRRSFLMAAFHSNLMSVTPVTFHPLLVSPSKPPFFNLKTIFAGHFSQSSNSATSEYGKTSPSGSAWTTLFQNKPLLKYPRLKVMVPERATVASSDPVSTTSKSLSNFHANIPCGRYSDNLCAILPWYIS